MTMLAKVKTALRISHTYLDDDIEDTISTARAELIRSGCSKDVAESNIELVQMAIKTYCQYIYADDTKLAEGYWKSWQFQMENIRKSTIRI